MEFKRSPYHYWYKYHCAAYVKPEPTDAMRFGDAVHTWVLEPNLWEEKFIVAPKVDRRTKAGKASWSDFEADAQGKIIITRDEFDLIENICVAVRKEDSVAESLIADAVIEQSYFFTHATSGVQCKARPDVLKGNVVADLKTAKDASYREFQRSAYNRGYFLQAAMIEQALCAHGIEMSKFVIIAVEKTPPFAVGIYILDDEALEWGRMQFDGLMEKLARHLDKNDWGDFPGYGIQTLCVPSYANYEVESEE